MIVPFERTLPAPSGIELWRSREHEAENAEFRAKLDALQTDAQETIFRLRGSLVSQIGLLVRYLQVVDLEPHPRASMEVSDDEAFAELREAFLQEFAKAQTRFASSVDDRHALEVLSKIRMQTEDRFAKQEKESRRMRKVAAAGVILVAAGSAAALIDALIRP